MMTVVFDFDGVIHSYVSGWKGVDIIEDPPVPGIKEAISDMRAAGYKVIVCSSRCLNIGGQEAVEKYLQDNEIIVDGVTGAKVPAIVYIDDRAICFNGHPETLLEKVKSFKTWNHEPIFYKCTLFGEECVFTTDKIEWDRYATLFLYELRKDEEKFFAVETRAEYNFGGTILSKIKLIENRERYYVVNGELGTELGEDDLHILTDEITLKEFLRKEGDNNE